MKKTALSLMMMLMAISTWAQDEAAKERGRLAALFCSLDVRNRWNHAGDVYRSTDISAIPISGNQTYDATSGISNYDYKKASYGAGFGVNLTVGYMFNDHWGASLGIGADLAPKKHTLEYKQTNPMGTVTLAETSTLKMPLYITPSVILSTGYNDPFQVYTRLGVAIPIGGKLTTAFSLDNSATGDIYEEDEEYDFYMSKGLTGALGASYRVSDQLNIFGEVNGMSLTRYVKSSTVTRAELNGVSELDDWDVEDIETEYTPNYFYDPATQTATMPTRSTVLTVPSSNFGVSVGASLGLGSPVNIKPKRTGLQTAMAYINANLAAGVPHAGSYYNSGAGPISGTQKDDATTGIISADYKKASYGAGISASIAGGYMFNEHLGAEMRVNIGVKPVNYTAIFEEIYNTGTVETTVETRAKMPIFLNPSIVLSTGDNKGISAYSRVGIAIPIGGNLLSTFTEVNHITNTTTVEEEEFEFGMSKGLTGALGLRYNINDAIGLRAEVNGMSLTRYTKSSTITGYTINGINELSSLNTYQRETEYQLNYSEDPANTNPDMPFKASTIAVPFSYFGFAIGADFRF